jgi:hypothetical protein
VDHRLDRERVPDDRGREERHLGLVDGAPDQRVCFLILPSISDDLVRPESVLYACGRTNSGRPQASDVNFEITRQSVTASVT